MIRNEYISPIWNGYINYAPERKQVLPLLLILEYLKLYNRFRPANIYDDESSPSSLKRQTFSNAKTKLEEILKVEEYNFTAKFIYEYLIDAHREYKILNELEDHIKPLIIEFYPQLKDVLLEQ